MKRYRIIPTLLTFDTSVSILQQFERLQTSPQMQDNIDKILASFKRQYGEANFEFKLENLKEIGSKPPSIISYHSYMLEEIRVAYVCGCYYPALTAACALGERILNHLILDLRDYFSSTEEYQDIKNDKSFTTWDRMIKPLAAWDVLLPDVAEKFRELKTLRHKSVHFNKNLQDNLGEQSLNAVTAIQEIVFKQFSGFGNEPWFLTGVLGELYIKKEYEQRPFVMKYYLASCRYVGYAHTLTSLNPIQIEINDILYEDGEITDEEFVTMRIAQSSSN